MLPRTDDWRTPDMDALLDAFVDLDDRDAAAGFMRDLCTLGELRDLAQRWAVVRLLDAGLHYSEISRLTGASTATITRIASWLHHGEGGYSAALARARSRGAGGDLPGADAAATHSPGGTRGTHMPGGTR